MGGIPKTRGQTFNSLCEDHAPASDYPIKLVKAKQCVSDHGEMFTSGWLVEAMPNLVKGKAKRIDSRFLEPACSSETSSCGFCSASAPPPTPVRQI